jgi:alpha-beta hydrolase superfamily lysophospholipase
MKAAEGPPIFLVAHSHGALVGVMAALRGLSGVAGMILTCPYFKSAVRVPWYKAFSGARVGNVLAESLRVSLGSAAGMVVLRSGND